MKSKLFIGLLLCTLTSCQFFQSSDDREVVARVDNYFLYKDEIDDLILPGTPVEDSIVIVKNYIDRWAQRKLLISAAELNLSIEKQEEFQKLINQYRDDLLTKAYLEEIVKQSIDTIVSHAELKYYYEQNKENFRTTGVLVRLRYIYLPNDHEQIESIKKRFQENVQKNKQFWERYQMQFKSSALNDSVWVEMNQIYRKLPFISPDNRDEYIKPGLSFEKKDSLDLYLVKIRDVIEKNEISPFEYLKPTLKEVILNTRKLELIKKIEKDITNDAIKNKKYEVFE